MLPYIVHEYSVLKNNLSLACKSRSFLANFSVYDENSESKMHECGRQKKIKSSKEREYLSVVNGTKRSKTETPVIKSRKIVRLQV